ncbi:DUF1003 domain-containing protein [Subtercola lobariae]|uniref:DUF1003 domain-containing protein n=1 Tax=Subtercola lobariae TaxID=1588641 RepID=A0A917B6E6_9MICO|nr:DUF1003 domain-containing protein [Subtercola lobariae]GGF27281.1 hypothetical protein GCM10011399_20730 [Subtercola lobariae]
MTDTLTNQNEAADANTAPSTPIIAGRDEVAQVHHPLVAEQLRRRANSVQLRVADAITAFAGSMRFVYLHAAIFVVWMLLFEQSPWPTLTLVVSLEAIFLSTFVMVGQNRQAAFQQAKADHDFAQSDHELLSNTELTRQVHELTKQIHAFVMKEAQAVDAGKHCDEGPTGETQRL